MNDLLPCNATRHERNLSLATGRVGSIPTDPIRNQWNPATCPTESLPWLAWALSVAPWNPDWTEPQKRSAIAASIQVHRVKGTLGGLKNALAALGYEVAINENTGTPFVFDVDLSASSQTVDSDTIIADATAIILQAKNARSKIGAVSLSVKSPANIYFGAASIGGVEISVFPAGFTP